MANLAFAAISSLTGPQVLHTSRNVAAAEKVSAVCLDDDYRKLLIIVLLERDDSPCDRVGPHRIICPLKCLKSELFHVDMSYGVVGYCVVDDLRFSLSLGSAY